MTTGLLLAVCRVHALLPTRDSTGVTAIDKRAVTGPVPVHPLGLSGDVQASRKHHGGVDKAVYAYSQEDADYWSAELGRVIEPGLFGENLRLSGIEVSNAVVGEQWRIGGEAILEVTQPRTPCVNFARRMGEPRWMKRFTEQNRVGSYLRVIKRGALTAGEPVEVISRPDHGVTCAQVFGGLDAGSAQRLSEAGTSGGLTLSRAVLKAITKSRSAPQLLG